MRVQPSKGLRTDWGGTEVKGTRLLVAATFFALAAALTLTVAKAIDHARVAAPGVVTAAQDRLLLRGAKRASMLHHLGVAKPGQQPRPVKLAPHAFHLTSAHSAVFDVRHLKGVVVKRERPDREAPG